MPLDAPAFTDLASFIADDRRLWHARKRLEWAIRHAWIARADYREWRDWSDDRRALAEHYAACREMVRRARQALAEETAELARRDAELHGAAA